MKKSQKMATRKFGIEMEGYIASYPRRTKIFGASIKRDYSLKNNDWRYLREEYGVEVVSRPIKNLGIVHRIFGEMSNNNWSVDEKAGTHVHIEIKDFDEHDKIKLLGFCKSIEAIVFSLVKDYRYGNRFCYSLHEEWGYMLFSEIMSDTIGMKDSVWPRLKKWGFRHAYNEKYSWCNVYGSRHKTVEFRLFHAVESSDTAVKFVKLANAIVDVAKNSTPEQLTFIISSLYSNATSVKEVVEKLYYSLGMDYEEDGLPIVGTNASRALTCDIIDKSRAM